MSIVLRSGSLSQLGGKAFALSQLECAGLPIPHWFAITPDAFLLSLPEQERAVLSSSPTREHVREMLCKLRVSDAVTTEVRDELNTMSAYERFAVRSSAVDEDGSVASFAGQLESFLFVAPDDVPLRVADVWRSGFSERLLAYRAEHGLPMMPHSAPAVLVQRMVNSDAAGVAFSADPISGRRSVALVSAVFGLGTALVGGEADADVYEVGRDGGILRRTIAEKRVRHRFDANASEGVSAIALADEQRNAPVLTDDQARTVAKLARQASAFFGRPQDIEWAYENDALYLLQSRPITTLAQLPDPDGELNIWDNSNITESYSGVTTPLTFSFARYIYEGVYRQFCRILRVPERKIIANDRTFQHMLGLIRGRVYYNLLNWYRVLALLPGFTLNRKFMEQMMGVRGALPEEVIQQLGKATFGARVRDAGSLAGMLAGLVSNYFSLNRQIKKFYKRLNETLAEPNPPLSLLRADELAVMYRDLEGKLLTRWDAPLVNDFFAMIFHGSLRKLTHKWLGDENGMLANDLVRGRGGIISTEPARRMIEMASIASTHPGFARMLREAPLPQVNKAMRDVPEFEAKYNEYLAKFGDRCLEELKLESVTLHDDPLLLLRNVGSMAGSPLPTSQTARLAGVADAEVRARNQLRFRIVRRFLFSWVLRNAGKLLRNRENLRFERTRLFGRVRRIFLEIGRRFSADGLLGEPRDIFYLQAEEIFATISGTTVTSDLCGLVALRKREFEAYRGLPAPPDRFETHGPVNQGNNLESRKTAQSTDSEQRKGLGCCAGVVRGMVQVVRDPRNVQLTPGCILVAERTDPGWVMLFPSAKGLLVERGSLLSHSAIVAREMGIPAVVSIAGVTEWLKDGDWVELDGGEGVVRKLKPAEAHA